MKTIKSSFDLKVAKAFFSSFLFSAEFVKRFLHLKAYQVLDDVLLHEVKPLLGPVESWLHL